MRLVTHYWVSNENIDFMAKTFENLLQIL